MIGLVIGVVGDYFILYGFEGETFPRGEYCCERTWGKQKQNIFFETFYSQFLEAIFLALGTLFGSLFALKMG